MARKVFIAGNWKMNKTAAETVELCKGLKEKFADICPNCVDVAVCPPFTSIAAAIAELKGSNIKVGAQNIHWADNGAFTGEISGAMLKEMGVEYVIIGHSERRQYFGETDATVNLRTLAAVKAGLTPDEIKNVVVAYEPVWAIGTGLTATDEQANETIGVIRAGICRKYGKEVADAVRIQYGGSMNPKNVKGLMAQPEIDGGLIGGASLKAPDFSLVVNYDK